MQAEAVRMDPLSEMLALSSKADTKNLIITMVELKGNFDREAMVPSVQKAVEKFPQLRSCFKETKIDGRFQLYRVPRPDLPVPVLDWDLSDQSDGGSRLDRYFEKASASLDRQWNLFTELPVEFHIVKYGPVHHMVGPVIHHAAADAGTASEFGKEILLNYHEAVTGERLDESCYSLATSTSIKRRARLRAESKLERFKQNIESLKTLMAPIVLPAGTGDSSDKRQFHIKRVLGPEESARIAAGALKGGASLMDSIVATTILSVDQWNNDRHIAPGIVTSSMTVNMRGRYSGMNTPNNSALLFFKFTPEQRSDPKTLARSISLARIRQFRKQLDWRYYNNIERAMRFLSRWPFRVRSKIIHYLTNKHKLSVALTLMGVVWPKDIGGRPSLESCLTSVGGLDVSEIHGLGYKLLSSTHVLLIVYMFKGRLNCTLAASACHFTQAEAESFLDLTLENLIRGQQGPR